MKKAVYAGSFDPITNGHLWIIEQGSKLFDQLIIAVGINPDKKYSFSEAERLKAIRKAIKGLNNVEVRVVGKQYIVDFAEKVEAPYLIRGVRSVKDFEEEKLIGNMNRKLNSNIEVVYLFPPKEVEDISSSLVKGLVGYEGWEDQIEDLVPASSRDLIFTQYLKPKWDNLMSRLNCKGGGLSLRFSSRPEPSTRILFEQIITNYSDKTRYYHNLRHLVYILDKFETVKDQAERPELVELALWLHDFFDDRKGYEKIMETTQTIARNQMNEEKDASYLESLIEATFHKGTPFTLKDQALISDIDLSILGTNLYSYKRYADRIRQEYPNVSDTDFNAGRGKILTAFLKRGAIFHSPSFTHLQQAARNNIQWELIRLNG